MKQKHELWKLEKFPEPKQWHLSKNWLYQSAKILKGWEENQEVSEQEFDDAINEASIHHG